MCTNCRRPKLPLIARLGRSLGNWNDRLYGRASSRWDRWSWRTVDRLAGRMYTWGER